MLHPVWLYPVSVIRIKEGQTFEHITSKYPTMRHPYVVLITHAGDIARAKALSGSNAVTPAGLFVYSHPKYQSSLHVFSYLKSIKLVGDKKPFKQE